MYFWENVQAVLEDRGLSLRWLAKEVGVSSGLFPKYSKGTVPRLDVAYRIAKCLGLSMDALLGTPPELRTLDDLKARPLPYEKSAEVASLSDETRRWVKGGGFESIPLSALRPNALTEWSLLHVLYRHASKGLTFSEIEGLLKERYGSVDRARTRDILQSLMHGRFLVRSTENGWTLYKTASGIRNFDPVDLPEKRQFMVEIIQTFIKDIFPVVATKPERGYSALIKFSTKLENGYAVIKNLKEHLRLLVRQSHVESGEEFFTIVVGLSVEQKNALTKAGIDV